MGLLILLTSDHCLIDGAGVVHACTVASYRRTRDKRRKTEDAVCGVRAKPYVAATDGNHLVMLAWPPRVLRLEEDQSRCEECHRLTGRPRPKGRP